MGNIRSFSVLAVIRAPLENYPPSLNQLQILAEQGSRIIIVDLCPHDITSHGIWIHPNVRRIRLKPSPINSRALRRFLAALIFFCVVRWNIFSNRPRIVISYDPYAMVATGLPRAFKVWHFHELFIPDGSAGILTRLAIWFSYRNAHFSNLVVFPDNSRRLIFQKSSKGDFHSEVVLNCPRRLEVIPKNLLRPTLSKLGVPSGSFILLFQGWVGPTRCIEKIIQSIPSWPKSAYFVIIGPVQDEYKEELEMLAKKLGVLERVIFLGRVPYMDLFTYTVGADAAFSIVSDNNQKSLNWEFSAGAINKRFEYMACGVPQIANVGHGMKELIEDTGVGLLVDPNNPREIGEAVCGLFNNPDRLKKMRESARSTHLGKLNYDYQFLTVLKKLEFNLKNF